MNLQIDVNFEGVKITSIKWDHFEGIPHESEEPDTYVQVEYGQSIPCLACALSLRHCIAKGHVNS